VGGTVSSWINDNLIFILVPLVAVWVIVLVDIVGQPRLSTRMKWIWGLGCTVLWPLMIAYWITRPVQGRIERTQERTSPRDRLVDAVLDHEDGRIDDSEMATIVRQLRGQ